MDSLLHDVYYNLSSPACYSGLNSVYKEAKKRVSSIKISDVKKFLQLQDTYTLHKSARRNFSRNKTVALGIDSDWQADLCDLKNLAKYNDGYKYILTVIDVLSKYAWAIPIKNKTPLATANGFRKILKSSGRKPWQLYTDKGGEFEGKGFQDLVKEYDFRQVSSESPDVKASVAERYNRTLKGRLWKYFTKNNSYRYIEGLPGLVHAINHSYHRSIKRRPVDVTVENEKEVWHTLYGKKKLIKPEFKFSVGDKVRITKYRGPFKKSYLPNFTEEIFQVTERIPRQPPVYRIKDWSSQPIKGSFYQEELIKVVKEEEIYKIESILKTRKRNGTIEHFVKWLGYPKQFNQWVNQSDLKSI